MKINKLLFATATLFAISTNLLLSEVKANSKTFSSFNVNGIKYDLKMKKQGQKVGQIFLRKNNSKNLCMTMVLTPIDAADFLKCSAKAIGKPNVKKYIVDPINKKDRTAGRIVMAGYKMF